MVILGIETSCDETAAALVRNGTELLSAAVASSEGMHQKTKGIVPEVAAREQVRAILPMVEEAMQGYTPDDVDALAVTVGPGLIGSLLVGVHTAQTLARVWQKPLIPVHHVLAHLYANWLGEEHPQLPALALIVSGGHTELLYLKDHGEYEWLGGTRDDAAGEGV